ncbi:16S rRNA (uracil(1498)-N(3))-methyltransferase [Oceanobacillus piezotolerans]|uniref:Ribosomal RNA small subunit methyltransferase E n=1 Tax=Oceanobacillus piezotolerans TaxID=2448030 RepID=A0A498DT38_9BACI|nr:16S rRNA (uracil(1498)-N(3))-methyltransferase [Oceanobacillus piezotolerans]RLL48037.1 16S rRNA (uracil(1498)-N(3))-methyltransferase [Oceanobacillus piezotolerans]
MQRYFVSSSNWNGNEVTIQGEDVHHIVKVMRNKPGDNIICNDELGKSAICEIKQMEVSSIIAEVLEWLDEDVEMPIHVTIAQGLPKGDKLDLILQKGTELGASAFIPFQSDRSVVVWDNKKIVKKMTRFSKIVKEASEQSHRTRIPTLHEPMNLDGIIKEGLLYDRKIFAYEEEAKGEHYHSFASILKDLVKGQKLLIVIGPEGGFSETEAQQLKSNGFETVRLGPRILRTETAPLYALASISYHFEEFHINE